MTHLRTTACLLGWLALAPPQGSRAVDALVTYRVLPSDTDAAITRFNDPHVVVFSPGVAPSADLLIFMPGTGGDPANVSDFLNVAASQGYRVVSLAYDDTPAVVAVCPQDPDPDCSAKVRQKRIFGDNTTTRIDDRKAESIVNRLVKLIAALDRTHPSEGWGQYLDGGAPNWSRIAVSGHSQGAGMAAYIAQKVRVARVILFSSPWDFYGRNQELAPWVYEGPGATPPDLWFGAYHKKENTAVLIAEAYKALKIPEAHVRVFTLEPSRKIGGNPYHLSMVGNGTTPRDAAGAPAYASEWRFLVGSSR
jgi:predicted esterase